MKLNISLSAKTEPRKFVVSDVHGCLTQLMQLLQKLKFTSRDKLYIMGDMIDRGPDSRGVLDFARKNSNVIALKGNHEDMAVQVYENPTTRMVNWWLGKGGDATLESFGVTSVKKIPRSYIEWMKSLPIGKRVGEFVLSHAGTNMHTKRPFSNSDKNNEYRLWNRNVESPTTVHAVSIVVGHTPKTPAAIKRSSTTRLVYIDGGCAYGGKLVSFCLNDRSLSYVKGASL